MLVNDVNKSVLNIMQCLDVLLQHSSSEKDYLSLSGRHGGGGVINWNCAEAHAGTVINDMIAMHCWWRSLATRVEWRLLGCYAMWLL
jgi:hypothetical protein